MPIMIGIMGAMPEEIQTLLESLEAKEEKKLGPFTLYKGLLEAKSVMIALCGISKVNAAALTQVMILEGIDKLIFTGVAGGLEPTMAIGDIVIGTDLVQHDVDVTALGYKLGEVPGEPFSWQTDAVLHGAALEAAKQLKDINVYAGRILSGDVFLDSKDKVTMLRTTFNGICAEMEGASVAQVCTKWNIPFVVIRSISDIGDEASEEDFRAFTPLAARRAKEVVRLMLRHEQV